MANTGFSFLLRSLGVYTPIIVVCMVGIIVAIIAYRRCPTAAGLTLLALGIHLIAVVGVAVVNAYLIYTMNDGGWDAGAAGQLISAIGVVGGLGRGLSIALLIAAVFVGRNQPLDAK